MTTTCGTALLAAVRGAARAAAVAGLSPRGARLPATAPVLVGEARRGGADRRLARSGRRRPRSARRAARAGRWSLIDPGHGGRDPGAPARVGRGQRKGTDAGHGRASCRSARQARPGARRDDPRGRRYLTLDQRAAIARRIGASLFVSIHMDSAPNPLARGATVYSLSDVASDAEAARFAAAENRRRRRADQRGRRIAASILSDLALRDQMAEFGRPRAAHRAPSRRAASLLRPEPHQFAAFHVLRRAEVARACCSRPAISAMSTMRRCCVTPGGPRADRRRAGAGDRGRSRALRRLR